MPREWETCDIGGDWILLREIKRNQVNINNPAFGMVASKYSQVITIKCSFYLEIKINKHVKEDKWQMSKIMIIIGWGSIVPILQLSGTDRWRMAVAIWIQNEAMAVERILRAVDTSSSEPRMNILSKLTQVYDLQCIPYLK